jgi:hypothetical protein
MSVIVASLRRLQQNFLDRSLHPVRALLPDCFVRSAAAGCGLVWRDRLFNPVLTLLACVYAHLTAVKSSRQVEDWINGFDPDVQRPASGSAFCDARKRLPLRLFALCCRRVADAASRAAGLKAFGLRVLLVDGTALRLGRTEANVRHFGRHANQRGLSARPVARALLIVCAGTGAVVSWLIGPFRCSERWMLNRLLAGLGAGCLLVGDAGLFSHLLLSRLARKGSHGLFRLPAWKSAVVKRKRIGRNDRLETWERPRLVHSRFPFLLKREPQFLCVRVLTCVLRRKGYRDLKLRLVTTLIDRHCTPAELLALYARRWDIELDIRDLKRTHMPKVLGGRTPQAAMREFAAGLLAFTLVRALAAQACEKIGDGDVRRISHTRSCQAIAEAASVMRGAPAALLPGRFKALLRQLLQFKQKKQERPPQPRALIRTRRRYPDLKISRIEYQLKIAA